MNALHPERDYRRDLPPQHWFLTLGHEEQQRLMVLHPSGRLEFLARRRSRRPKLGEWNVTTGLDRRLLSVLFRPGSDGHRALEVVRGLLNAPPPFSRAQRASGKAAQMRIADILDHVSFVHTLLDNPQDHVEIILAERFDAYSPLASLDAAIREVGLVPVQMRDQVRSLLKTIWYEAREHVAFRQPSLIFVVDGAVAFQDRFLLTTGLNRICPGADAYVIPVIGRLWRFGVCVEGGSRFLQEVMTLMKLTAPPHTSLCLLKDA